VANQFWEGPTHKIIDLQLEWKEADHIDYGDENKLWKKFHEACDKLLIILIY
jgi:hypothetical protein